MTPVWNDETYPMLSPGQQWRLRAWHGVLCFFHAHAPGVPQRRDPRDLGRSAGPCRYCGGEHYWRYGRWVMAATEAGQEGR